jgi:hypothetical protein
VYNKLKENKMLISHTVPTKYLRKFDEFSSVYLVLGHLIGKDEEYTNFFTQSKKYKYIDNSAYELGEAIKNQELVDKAHLINADALVLPDVFMDGLETLKRTYAFLEKFRTIHKDFDLVAVPQGKTPEEYLDCASELLKIKEIKTIAVSFLVVARCFSIITRTNDQNVLANRPLAVGMVRQLMRLQANQLNIHLLGLGNPIELSCYNNKGFVVSCDSSVAFALANVGLKVNNLGCPRDKFDHLNFDETDTSAETLLLAERNIRRINSFI